jgi:hypothetical protein
MSQQLCTNFEHYRMSDALILAIVLLFFAPYDFFIHVNCIRECMDTDQEDAKRSFFDGMLAMLWHYIYEIFGCSLYIQKFF